MIAKRRLAMIAGLVAVAAIRIAAPALADGPGAPPDGMTIQASVAQPSTSVGVPVVLRIDVTNAGPAASPPMAVHIDVTDPKSKFSVDPEDWTPELTRPLAALAPGESARLDWSLSPVSGGEYVVYAVLLRADAGTAPTGPVVSNGAPIHVDEKRSFNPQGVTPLAAGIPLAIAALLVWRRRGPRLRPKA